MPRLTKRIVEAAEPKEAAYFVWCSDLPGFGVRIFPTGKRIYYADYRPKVGARKRMSLGAHGKLTTEEARKLALQTLGDVLKGEDPAEERATRRKSMTVSDLCERYMVAAGKGLILGKGRQPKKPSTIVQDRARIDRHIVPVLGKKLVRDLSRADVARFIRDVTTGKTAADFKSDNKRGRVVVTGGAGTASRAASLLGAILNWAVAEEILDMNPARGMKRQADQKRTRRLTAEEYRALGKALARAEDARETEQGIAAAWLLALTGCRLGEVLALRWSEVDAAGRCFRLADTKEGASVRPVGTAAFDVLDTIERQDDEPHVLPATRGKGHYGGFPGFWRRLMTTARLEGVTAHTLRHSYASVAGDLGFTEIIIGAMLGHASGSVTSRYVHHLDAVLIAAADKVTRAIHAQMTGEEAKVVRLPGRRSAPSS